MTKTLDTFDIMVCVDCGLYIANGDVEGCDPAWKPTRDAQLAGRVSGEQAQNIPGKEKDMTMIEPARPLVEKQRRMQIIALAMYSLSDLERIACNDMGNFSMSEAQAFHDAVDMLQHFITLASVQT